MIFYIIYDPIQWKTCWATMPIYYNIKYNNNDTGMVSHYIVFWQFFFNHIRFYISNCAWYHVLWKRSSCLISCSIHIWLACGYWIVVNYGKYMIPICICKILRRTICKIKYLNHVIGCIHRIGTGYRPPKKYLHNMFKKVQVV